MPEPDFLLFASDAELAALWGATSLVVALLCMVMEQRRMKRARIDRVGWVPWTAMFMMFAIVGGGLLALSIPTMLQG